MPMCIGGVKRLLIMPPIDTARMALLVECRYMAGVWMCSPGPFSGVPASIFPSTMFK
jgi:hypothetical protein